MPCRKIRTGKGLAIICSRTKPKQCFYCDGLSDFQCDFPTVRYKSGRKKGKWRTCDKHLCRIHAKSGISKNVDFCPEHYPKAKAAFQRREKLKQLAQN